MTSKQHKSIKQEELSFISAPTYYQAIPELGRTHENDEEDLGR
jgi:hypothetical protein